MKTKEEILKGYNELAQEVKALNASTNEEKEKFHMFFIGGHITEKNGDKFLVGASHLISESSVLGKLMVDDEAAHEFMDIGVKARLAQLFEKMGGNNNDK